MRPSISQNSKSPLRPERSPFLHTVCAFVLAGVLVDLLLNGFKGLGSGWAHVGFWVGVVACGGSVAVWRKGLGAAGRGWRRALYLTALAGTIVWMALSVGDFLEGFRKGVTEGFAMGRAMAQAERHEQGLAPAPPGPSPLEGRVIGIQDSQIKFWMWVLFTGLATVGLHRLQAHSEEAERQGRLAREARGQALRAKLAPHFIFNTLNTLHAQIEEDPRGAQATTERLAALFRQVVEVSDQATVPLKKELAFVEAYLGIEQARMGGRLRVRVEVPEELETLPVPPLSLQVLVENAIKHGVAPLERGGEVRVGAERRGNDLYLFVDDPGDGKGTEKGTGTALETLRQRLAIPTDLSMGQVQGGYRVGFLWRFE